MYVWCTAWLRQARRRKCVPVHTQLLPQPVATTSTLYRSKSQRGILSVSTSCVTARFWFGTVRGTIEYCTTVLCCAYCKVVICVGGIPCYLYCYLYKHSSTAVLQCGTRTGRCTGGLFSLAMNTRYCMYGNTYSKSMDQPGMVANPARGQLNRETEYSPVRVRA